MLNSFIKGVCEAGAPLNVFRNSFVSLKTELDSLIHLNIMLEDILIRQLVEIRKWLTMFMSSLCFSHGHIGWNSYGLNFVLSAPSSGVL
jgi:hypothetical protein